MDTARTARPLLLLAGLALALALLLRGALAVSSNPVEGETGYDLTEWLAGLLQMLSVGLLSAWAAVRTVLRAREASSSSCRSHVRTSAP